MTILDKQNYLIKARRYNSNLNTIFIIKAIIEQGKEFLLVGNINTDYYIQQLNSLGVTNVKVKEVFSSNKSQPIYVEDDGTNEVPIIGYIETPKKKIGYKFYKE